MQPNGVFLFGRGGGGGGRAPICNTTIWLAPQDGDALPEAGFDKSASFDILGMRGTNMDLRVSVGSIKAKISQNILQDNPVWPMRADGPCKTHEATDGARPLVATEVSQLERASPATGGGLVCVAEYVEQR